MKISQAFRAQEFEQKGQHLPQYYQIQHNGLSGNVIYRVLGIKTSRSQSPGVGHHFPNFSHYYIFMFKLFDPRATKFGSRTCQGQPTHRRGEDKVFVWGALY